MKFCKNDVFGLWVVNEPSILQLKCWNSWIRLGYNLTLFVDDPKHIPSSIASKIKIVSIHAVLPSFTFKGDNLLQQTDLWRFMYLEKYGGTWLDSDLYLCKRIPHADIIISSEHTLQAGGRKSKSHKRANIGLLRFPPNHRFIKAVVAKLTPKTKEDENTNSHDTSKMMKFIKLLNTKKWLHMKEYVAEPEAYCPVPYSFAKELYTHDKDLPIKTKYGLELNYMNEETIGLHLWANICRNKKIDLDKIHPNSLFLVATTNATLNHLVIV